MAIIVRVILASMMNVAVIGVARSQAAMPAWMPDEATVKLIDTNLKLPSMEHWVPGPLDSYARYYIGVMQNGRKVIYGNLLRGRMAREKPGIYLRAAVSLTGGGCDQISLWYDVDMHMMLHIQCYGLG